MYEQLQLPGMEKDDNLSLSGLEAAGILAQAREYDFGLIAAAQFPSQLTKNTNNGFYKNTGSKITFSDK